MLSQHRLLILVSLLAFLFPEEICAGNLTEFFGTVRDLKVELYQNEKMEKSELYKSLKLNISWIPPQGNRPPSSYSVIVMGILDEDMADCPEGSIFYTSRNNKELNVLLPQTNDFIDMSEMHIFPGCSYKIQVYANPRSKSFVQTPEITYRVPDCVSGNCNCLSAKSALPVPKLNVFRARKGFSIEWNVSNNDSNIHFYAISIGQPILTSKTGLLVYNTTKIGEVYAPRNVYHVKQNDMEIKSGFKITVTPVDFHGCFGNESSFIIPPIPLHQASTETIWFLLVGAIALCTMVVSLLLLKIRTKYNLLWRPRSIPRMPGIFKCKSQWAEAMLNRQNVLYVRYDPQKEADSERDNLELSYKNLSLVHELGRGQFGKVYLGRLNDGEGTLVAVKTSQCFDELALESRKEFMEEVEIMKQAGTHPHLVRLIGYCSEPDKPVCIILEYMQGGDLLAYLHSRRKLSRSRSKNESQSTSGRSSRPSISETIYTALTYISEGFSDGNPIYSSLHQAKKYINEPDMAGTNEQTNMQEFEDGTIGKREFLKFSMDITSGMSHLEAKGITHRDLASRNILVGSDLTLKISDFGLSRNGVYVIKTKGSKARHLPIRWMSPEAVRDRAFSSKSDVWSFGIVLWEIGTLGSFPYPSVSDDCLLRYIIREGGRLERPETIPMDVYGLMQRCWATEAEDRPSFQEISLNLQAINAPSNGPTSASNPCYALSLETLQS